MGRLLAAALGALFLSGPALGLEGWTKEGERWIRLVRRGDRKAKGWTNRLAYKLSRAKGEVFVGWTSACGTAVEHTTTGPSTGTGSFANAKALTTTFTMPAHGQLRQCQSSDDHLHHAR